MILLFILVFGVGVIVGRLSYRVILPNTNTNEFSIVEETKEENLGWRGRKSVKNKDRK